MYLNMSSKKFKILNFLLFLVIIINFFYLTHIKSYAIDIVSTTLALKLFTTLLVAAGVTFTAVKVSEITELFDYWKVANPAMFVTLAQAAYSSALSGVKASISNSLWSNIRKFSQDYFKEGSHSDIVIEDNSGSGSGSGSSFLINDSNSYYFDSSYSSGGFEKVIEAVWPADDLREIKGYRLDSSDRLLAPDGSVLVDPETKFGNYYDEVIWSLYFDPNDMHEARITVSWVGAYGMQLTTVPVTSYDDNHISIGVNVGSGVFSLPVPYIGHSVLGDSAHDFNDGSTREIGFPWLGDYVGTDFYDGTIENIINETNGSSSVSHLEKDLSRLLGLGWNDVVNTGFDSAVPAEGGSAVNSGFGSLGNVIVDVDLSGITGLLEMIKDILNNLLGGIKGLLTNILSAITGLFAIGEDVSLDFTPLQGLQLYNKFPFSIPWDIKESFSSLNTPAVVPNWDIMILSETVNINFAQFEVWARIVRWGLLIIFNGGLIKITRNIIRG